MRLLITLSLILCLAAPVAGAYDRNDRERAEPRPNASEMIVDGLIVRPLSLAGTIVGSGIFLVTLPISALGGNVDEAGETLVKQPARATFQNCLGCLPGVYQRDHPRREQER